MYQVPPEGNAWLVIIVTCLVAPLSHAGIDCSRQLTAIESQICEEPLLSQDRQLNQQYAAILKLPDVDKARVRAGQKRWLSTVRDACSDYTCLSEAYSKRLLELWELRMTLTEIEDKPLSSAVARRDCQAIAALADRRALAPYLIPGYDRQDTGIKLAEWEVTASEAGKYEDRMLSDAYRIYRLRTGKQNRLQRFGEFASGGTCSWRHIFSIDRLISGKPVPILDELNEQEGSLSYDTDTPIFFHQRNYILNSSTVNFERSLVGISWVRPDGGMTPVCHVSNAREPRIMESRLPELCEGILSGVIKPLEGQLQLLPSKEDQPDVIARFFHDPPNAEDFRLIRIDLEGDGKEDQLGVFEESRMAGWGFTFQWLYALDRPGEPGKQKSLNALLDRSEANTIYSYRGQAYFQGTDLVYDWKIFRIRDGQVEPVCRFQNPNTVELVHP